jgi:uncharacterized membrane protein (DUF2068 family)
VTAKRPIGFTILALALCLLSFAGIANSFVFSDPIAMRALAVAYGVAGLIAGVAIWQRRTWASMAFVIWSCIVLVSGVTFDILFNLGPSLRGTVFVLVLAGVLWLAYRYVRKHAITGA